MTEQEFIKENASVWKELDSEIRVFNRHTGKKKLDKKRIDRFVVLYNKAANHLAYSRTYYGECPTSEYLNKLAGSAHALVYSRSESRFLPFLKFFVTGFPQLLRKYSVVFFISTEIFVLSGLFSFVLTAINIENALLFVPKSTLSNIRGEGQYDEPVASYNTLLGAYIGTNNIQVSFIAFALGITLGIGTVYILIQNGLIIGTYAGIVFHRGQSLFFWSLILPHGVSELFAIFVSGAAGLIIGYSLINPGKVSRKDALVINGLDAVKLVVGCIPVLIISAVIEGYFTPLDLDYAYKYSFSLMMLVLVILYVAIPGRKKRDAEL